MERERTSRQTPVGRIGGGLAAALLLAACAGEPSVPPTEDGPLGGDGSASGPVVACEELEHTYDPPPEEQPRIDPSPVDEPVGADAGDVMNDARRWAQREAPEHFAGVWLDGEAGGPAIAFTDDVDAYADEIRERFGEHWWVVHAARSEAELIELQGHIVEEEMDDGGISEYSSGTVTTVGLATLLNRVSIGVLEPDEARLAELGERYGADRICVEVGPLGDEEDAQPAPWEPVSDADLSAEATSIDVLVNEMGCASGMAADGRIATPEVSYEDDAVVVTIRVVPRPGPQTCPGNPDTEYTLELDEPLGDRELLDGAHNPPVTPDLERRPPDLGVERSPADDLGDSGDAGPHAPLSR